MGRVRVAIADDDEAMRSAMRSVLADDPRVEVVDAVGTGQDLVRVAEQEQLDVVVLDVRLPGGGEPTTQALRALAHPPVVVAVSGMDDRGTVLSMLRAGASGYLAKDRIGGSLAEIVVRSAAGEVALAVGCAQRLVADLTAG